MRYRDPATGKFISESEWLALQEPDMPEPDWPDDEYEWDFDFEEGFYDGA
jgi:hypothetical protein